MKKTIAILLLATTLLLSGIPALAVTTIDVEPQTMEVTGKTLNVREWRRDLAKPPVFAELSKGAKVTLIGEENGWSLVRWHDGSTEYSGYVSAKSIKPAGAVMYYATEEVNVRSGAGTAFGIVGVLDAGDAVTFIKKAGKWTLVSFDGKEGYVFSKYLTKNRISGFYGSTIARMVGKKNIHSVEYFLRQVWGRGGQIGSESESLPVIEITYLLKTDKAKRIICSIGERRYATASEAAQVKQSIITASPNTGHVAYFQKDNLIISYMIWDNYDFHNTPKEWEALKREREVLDRVFAGLQAIYGESFCQGQKHMYP